MGIRATIKKLYDQFGRAIEPRKLTSRPDEDTRAVVSLNDRWSDYPDFDLAPERLASFLREADAGDPREQAQLWEAVEERNMSVGTHIQTRKLAIQGTEFDWQPSDDSPEAKAAADLVTVWARGIDDWDDIIADGLDALGNGWSIAESLWDYSSGQAWIAAIKHVPAKLCTWANSLTPRIVTSQNSYPGIELEPWKFWYNRFKSKSGDDFRGGLCRGILWCHLFQSYTLKDWISFAEIYGMPLRLGKYPAGASPTDKSALLRALRSLGTDAAGIISKDTEIEFVESMKAAVTNVYEPMIGLMDRYIVLRILGQTLTSSGSDGGGSRALGEVHNEVRGDIMRSDIRALTGSFRRDVLRPLVGFNLGWDVPVPVWHFQTEPAEDEVALATKYKTLVDMGFPVSVEHVSDRFKIPAAAAGETVLRTPANVLPGIASVDQGGGSAAPRPPANGAGDGGNGGAEAIADQATTVQDTALNGAQVTALQGIVQAVANGQLPAASALQLIQVSFPAITKEQALAIVNPMKGFTQTVPPPDVAAAERSGTGTPSAGSAPDDPAQAVIERDTRSLVNRARAESGPVIEKLWQPVKELLASCKTLEEFRDRLLDALPGMDPTDFGNLMQRGLMTAEMEGRFTVAARTGKK